MQAAISCLAALLLTEREGGASPDVLRQETLREALDKKREERQGGGDSHGYLGNRAALTAAAARKRERSYFDAQIDKARKQRARHNLRRKGYSASKARDDLSSFFDTLGLTKSHEHARVEVHEQRVVNHNKKVGGKTTVNVYITAEHETKQKKAQLKAHALNKKIKEAKAKSFTDEGTQVGLPLPHALAPHAVAPHAAAQQQQLAASKKKESRFDEEMKEAKSLLKSSKMERALSQARTLSLKADAPYYTSR